MAEAAYDYVIVGAGSAGCALAGRLSEDPGVTVAVLEAGGDDDKTEIHVPLAFKVLFKGSCDWNFTTAKQPEMAGRQLYWPRGKVLGGSSSMNAQMWVRGHRDDYDGWGVPGWSYKEVLPYFHRAERRQGSNRNGVYGTEGPLHVQELRDPNPATGAFLAACAEIGLDRLAELNEPDNTGYAPTPVTQRRGRRWSAADAYLHTPRNHPAGKRPNVTVITNAHARRVVLDEGRATGVEYSNTANVRHRVTARREVILSAGAIGSPQLLMLSGIGEPAALRAAGVEPVHELPGVGANLQDHLASGITLHCPRPITLKGAESKVQLVRYLLFRRGLLTSNVGEAVAFVRTVPEENAPDIELIFAPGPYVEHGLSDPPGHGITVGVILLRPESRGGIRLQSADPGSPPAIDPGYLSAPDDLQRMISGLKIAKRVLETDALEPYCGASMEPWRGAETDDELGRYIREHGETLYHPVGTCRMGEDAEAVVDPALRVRGLAGLRVVDASVMPQIIRGHTHAPTVMIAERAADLIRSRETP